MKIKKIQIKNVRGINDLTIDFKDGLMPNKPNLLVAPNGSGKTSFALAFKMLNRMRIKLDEKEAFQDNIANKPEINIHTDEPAIYFADENNNTITNKFGIYVINIGLKPKSANIVKGIPLGSPQIIIEPIELLDKLPPRPILKDNFEKNIDLTKYPPKTFPSITEYLKNHDFLAKLNLKEASVTDKQYQTLCKIIEDTDVDGLTFRTARKKLAVEFHEQAKKIKHFNYLITIVSQFSPRKDPDKIVVEAFRLLCFIRHQRHEIIEYYDFLDATNKKSIIEDRLRALPKTWKDIKPINKDGKLSINIGNALKISNGERDLTVFLSHLIKAEASLPRDANILIIDEVFDYLDDANLMVAQYEITTLIEVLKAKNRCLFPIILTHVTPHYYKSYSFSDLKVYYLKDMPRPHASDNILKLVTMRKISEIAYNEISQYLFHYHPFPVTLTIDPPIDSWKEPTKFKEYCNNQLSIYLGEMNADEFDPLGVCIALRDRIEKFCYDMLGSDADKNTFLTENGTKKKLGFLREKGLDLPELFSILGNLYNNPLHATDRNQVRIAQTLYSRMHNNHIRDMVRELCEITDNEPA